MEALTLKKHRYGGKQRRIGEIYTIKAAHAKLLMALGRIDIAPEGSKTQEVPAPPSAHIITDKDLDSEGIRWDSRIHSAGKEKTVKKGTWKLKLGLDPTYVKSVKRALKKDTSPTIKKKSLFYSRKDMRAKNEETNAD